MTVVPKSVLTLLTWCNLERGVCGDRDVTLAHLKAACKYFELCTVKLPLTAESAPLLFIKTSKYRKIRQQMQISKI